MTWSQAWILLGVFAWIMGFTRVGRVRENDHQIIRRTFVSPPFLIYLICGMPRARNIPKGVMAIPALMLQLQGLFWIGFGWTSPEINFQNPVFQEILFIVGTICILIYGWILFKRSAYKVE